MSELACLPQLRATTRGVEKLSIRCVKEKANRTAEFN